MDVTMGSFFRLTVFTLVLLGCFPAWATARDVAFDENSNTQFVNVIHYDQYNGLLGRKVTQIDQDSEGYLWIATHQGLNRFDSQKFIHFSQDSLDANSLPSNEISLFVQTTQDIWISLNNVGLALYEKASNQFKLIPQIEIADADSDQGIFKSMVFALAADHADNMWVFQFDGGISVYNRQNQKFSHLTPENTPWLQSVRFFDAKTAANGHIWAVTLEGVVYDIDPKTHQAAIHRLDITDLSAKEARIYGISQSSDGEIYLAAYRGVYRFDAQQNKFNRIIRREHFSLLMGEPLTVRNITVDSAGRLWLSTVKGLALFNNGLLSRIQFISQGEVLGDDINIRSVYEDKEHNIWVASDNMGVMRLNHRWHETTIKRPFSEDGYIHIDNYVHSAGDFDDSFWLYDSRQHSLTLNHYKNGRFKTLKTFGDDQQLPDQINGLYLDRNYRLWVVSAMGLYRLDPVTKLFEPMGDHPGARLIFEIGNKLFVTFYGDKQLYRWFEQDQSVRPEDGQLFMNDIQNNPVFDRQGHVWLTGNKGLEVLDKNSLDPIRVIRTQEGFNDIMLEQVVVWLLSNGKILRYRLQDNELIHQDTSRLNQLVSTDGIYRLKIINQQLWLTGQTGVVVINPDENRIIKRYTNTDNLPGRMVHNTFAMHDGSTMMVTANGLVHIKDPSANTYSEHPATLVLERIRHNGETVSSLSQLPYNYGSIQIDYQLLSFSQPDSHRYQYRLTTDQPWLDAGHQTSQNFYQLPAGHYRVQIRGKSLNQEWSEPLTMAFQVTKAPWKTERAYWLYAALAFILAAVLFLIARKRWQYNQELNYAREKQTFVENQLTLTHSLVQSVDVEELFAQIKQRLGQHIQCSRIEICYWNNDNNDQIFSDPHLTVAEKNRLGSLALSLYESDEKYRLETIDGDYLLHVLFSHSEQRLGLITFSRQDGAFKKNSISLAMAYVAQASLAIENARLFQAVQHLAEQAKISSKAKSDFLAQVSHEIRTPMNGILGMNQLLLESPLNADQRLYAEAVNESGEHLLDIINDILDLSKIEAGKLMLEHKAFDLVELVDEMTQSFVSVSKNKRLDFITCLDAELPAHWLGDATRIKQIIINLLSNAFKFTQQGQVMFSVQPGHHADEVLIVVRDTGMGIEQSMINNLFDPFAQADSSITRKYGGTGLGLSIVKQLCEKMAGDIHIDSQPKSGTEVSCLIKLTPNPSVSHGPVASRSTACVMANDSAVKSALAEYLLRLGLLVSYDIEEPFDYLFVVDHDETPYQEAIGIAQRDFRPVYLVKSQLQNNPRHQGSFKVINWPFTFKQLTDLMRAPQQQIKPEPNPITNGRPLHLLVLEDNAINQQLLLELLEKAGHMVDIFDDPYQALNALDRSRYDALLVDYHLPNMTGVDFVLAAREIGHACKVVMMSADISDELKRRCQQHNMDKLIIKPFKIEVLMRLLNPD